MDKFLPSLGPPVPSRGTECVHNREQERRLWVRPLCGSWLAALVDFLLLLGSILRSSRDELVGWSVGWIWRGHGGGGLCFFPDA